MGQYQYTMGCFPDNRDPRCPQAATCHILTKTIATLEIDRFKRMIEHLILILIEALANRDRAEQQAGLQKAVPDLDLLRADPAAALTEREVVIPAVRRGSMSLLLGLFVGLTLFVLVFGVYSLLRPILPLPRPMREPMRFALVAAALVVLLGLIVLGYALARRWMRGGELVLKRSGAEFRYRHTSVLCPWGLFRVELSAIQGDNRKVVFPVPAHVIDRIEVYQRDAIVGMGRDAKIKSIRFVSDTELELTNVYAANLREVARLLVRIGARMG